MPNISHFDYCVCVFLRSISCPQGPKHQPSVWLCHTFHLIAFWREIIWSRTDSRPLAHAQQFVPGTHTHTQNNRRDGEIARISNNNTNNREKERLVLLKKEYWKKSLNGVWNKRWSPTGFFFFLFSLLVCVCFLHCGVVQVVNSWAKGCVCVCKYVFFSS